MPYYLIRKDGSVIQNVVFKEKTGLYKTPVIEDLTFESEEKAKEVAKVLKK